MPLSRGFAYLVKIKFMENIWFNRQTNPDFIDLLSREIIKSDVSIKRSEEKRIKTRIKRKLKRKALKRKI